LPFSVLHLTYSASDSSFNGKPLFCFVKGYFFDTLSGILGKDITLCNISVLGCLFMLKLQNWISSMKFANDFSKQKWGRVDQRCFLNFLNLYNNWKFLWYWQVWNSRHQREIPQTVSIWIGHGEKMWIKIRVLGNVESLFWSNVSVVVGEVVSKKASNMNVECWFASEVGRRKGRLTPKEFEPIFYKFICAHT